MAEAGRGKAQVVPRLELPEGAKSQFHRARCNGLRQAALAAYASIGTETCSLWAM